MKLATKLGVVILSLAGLLGGAGAAASTAANVAYNKRFRIWDGVYYKH